MIGITYCMYKKICFLYREVKGCTVLRHVLVFPHKIKSSDIFINCQFKYLLGFSLQALPNFLLLNHASKCQISNTKWIITVIVTFSSLCLLIKSSSLLKVVVQTTIILPSSPRFPVLLPKWSMAFVLCPPWLCILDTGKSCLQWSHAGALKDGEKKNNSKREGQLNS